MRLVSLLPHHKCGNQHKGIWITAENSLGTISTEENMYHPMKTSYNTFSTEGKEVAREKTSPLNYSQL